MPYSILGWVSTGLLALLILPYLLVQINKAFIKGKNKGLLKVIRFLRKLHKPTGIVLLLVAAYHGYLALGSIRLHTGIVLFLFVLATVVLGGSFYRLKDKKLLKLHRVLSLMTIVMFFIHFFFPRLFS